MKLLTLLITLTTLADCLSAGLKLCNIDSVAGCKENNMCAHLQNGECTVSDDGQCGYECVCKSGWKGDKCDERVSSWSLVMKLKAGSSEFKYDSAYWTNSATLNPSSTTAADTDNIDAKLDAFNTVEVDAFKVCYKTLSNCYEYTLPQTYSSAKALFSAGHVRLTSLDKEAFTDLFLPPGTPPWYDYFWNGHGGGKCGMQRPGINTQCHDSNWARIGYCVNLPDQSCQPNDHNDADSPIGIGLKTQNWPNNVNAPFGEYTIHGAGPSVVAQFQHQAWLFVKNNKPVLTASTCDEQSWPDKDHGLVCGECKVLVNRFDSHYKTCDGYCRGIGRACTGAWEETGDTCEVKHDMSCDQTLATSDAICECGST